MLVKGQLKSPPMIIMAFAKLRSISATVPSESIDPSGRGHTSSFPQVVADTSTEVKIRFYCSKDGVQLAAVNLPRVKRRGLPQERTIRTDCISKVIVIMCEDFHKHSRCEKCA